MGLIYKFQTGNKITPFQSYVEKGGNASDTLTVNDPRSRFDSVNPGLTEAFKKTYGDNEVGHLNLDKKAYTTKSGYYDKDGYDETVAQEAKLRQAQLNKKPIVVTKPVAIVKPKAQIVNKTPFLDLMAKDKTVMGNDTLVDNDPRRKFDVNSNPALTKAFETTYGPSSNTNGVTLDKTLHTTKSGYFDEDAYSENLAKEKAARQLNVLYKTKK